MKNLMIINSRKKILVHLGKAQSASAAELGRALRVTPANARHHLSLLLADGLVEVVQLRTEGRGRPVKVYGLSQAALGNNLARLSSLVLDGWLKSVPEEQREAALVELANRLLPADTHSAPLHLMRRLARCVDRLNGLHYHARWEAHAAGPRIILGHCPYITIINEHPELCRMDALLLQGQLDHAVEQLVKLETSERGLRYCVFAVE